MTTAVLKQLLKDRPIRFKSKTKKIGLLMHVQEVQHRTLSARTTQGEGTGMKVIVSARIFTRLMDSIQRPLTVAASEAEAAEAVVFDEKGPPQEISHHLDYSCAYCSAVLLY